MSLWPPAVDKRDELSIHWPRRHQAERDCIHAEIELSFEVSERAFATVKIFSLNSQQVVVTVDFDEKSVALGREILEELVKSGAGMFAQKRKDLLAAEPDYVGNRIRAGFQTEIRRKSPEARISP